MGLLGDVRHEEFRFGPSGDGVSISARQVHGLCQGSKIVLDAPDGPRR
jgi:hypothetical protein